MNRYLILEHNGDYVMGLMLDTNGDNLKFNTETEAEKYAETECAFNYKIVKL